MHPPIRPQLTWFSRRVLHQRNVSTLPLTINQIFSRQKPSPEAHDNEPITVHGWIKSVRKQKRFAFAEIRDGTTSRSLQAVLTADSARQLSNGMSVALQGNIVHTPSRPQPMELNVVEVKVLGDCDPETYPIQKQSLSVPYLREQVHLRPRTDSMATILRLRDKVARYFHEFYEGQDFLHVHPPILTGNDCEGGGDVFRALPSSGVLSATSSSESHQQPATQRTEFFGKPSYLTVSSQLHLEALASALSRVYTLSPTFRAEASQTNRHLSEFYMLEAEMCFTQDLNSVMDVVEESIKHVLRRLAGPTGMLDELKDLRRTQEGGSLSEETQWWDCIEKPWTRMTYTEAIRTLSTPTSPVQWGEGLSSEQEKELARRAGGPIFITDYPTSLKPFYMRSNPASDSHGPTVACFDLLVPSVAELVGGSLREERLAELEASMTAHGLPTEELNWYLDLRRYGSVPHGGFGVGFERFVSWISGVDNVRECCAFPRWAGRMAG
ncbi:asparaginyl-tRNA synthetase [Tulasnella sp. 417]|nr:asparaginyl-tRNA synthetase [Tulasnella sp. 417]